MLRQKAKPVKRISAGIRRLLDDMQETMYVAPGVGLAAPQVGIAKRVIVVDVGEGLVELINPDLIEHEGLVKGLEGCLSIPGFVGDVERYQRIRVTGLDRRGRQVWIDAEGFFARALQHEMDHLDGRLYTDIATNVRPVEAQEEAGPEGDAREAAGGEAAGEETAGEAAQTTVFGKEGP